MAAVAVTSGGLIVEWGATHRDGRGELISRQMSITPPEVPTCLSVPCLFKYVKQSVLYALTRNYHAKRVAYAEANRNKAILKRYRTGEPSPQNIWQAIHANIKIKCPICRKYDVDPLLFRR